MKFIFIVLSGVGLFFCVGWDFRPPSFEESLCTGKYIFVATVENSSIAMEELGKITVETTLNIEECLRGELCKESNRFKLRYFSNTVIGTNFPVNFPVGHQVIVILNKKISKKMYEFDSDIAGGVDFVYDCNAFPDKITDKGSSFKCKYLETSGWLTFDDVLSYTRSNKCRQEQTKEGG